MGIMYIKGRKNHKGEPRPWVIIEIETDSIIAGFATKELAEWNLNQLFEASDDEIERLIESW